MRFDSASTVALAASNSVLVDLGPQPALWTVLQGAATPRSSLLATTTKKTGDQRGAFLDFVSNLFRLGVAFDLRNLWLGLQELPQKIEIPSYPFQRHRHYPSIRISRHASSNNIPRLGASLTSKLEVGQSLFHLLADHAVDATRILPAVALADFVLRTIPGQTLNLNLHTAFLVDSPSASLDLTVAPDGSFTMYESIHQDKICSGGITPSLHVRPLPNGLHSTEMCLHRLSHEQIYGYLAGGINFGPRFRNIQSFEVWNSHADAVIASDEQSKDRRVQLLDPILHGFGALAMLLHEKGLHEHIATSDSILLPSYLHGLTFHVHDLPSTFICRYRLPIQPDQDFRSMSIAFEVVTQSGELLVSCERYSVALVPKVLLLRDSFPTAPSHSTPYHLQTQWRESSPHLGPSSADPEFILYLGTTQGAVFPACKAIWPKASLASLYLSTPESSNESSLMRRLDDIHGQCSGLAVFLILDFTEVNQTEQRWIRDAVFIFLKSVIRRRTQIVNFLTFTNLSMPIQMGDGVANPPGALGSIVQGIMRVFRTEMGLQGASRLIDLQSADDLSLVRLAHILRCEANVAQREPNGPTCVAWRGTRNEDMTRLIPILLPVLPSSSSESDGVLHEGAVVIAGMGSIGLALASALLAHDHSRHIIFLGRRPSSDSQVLNLPLEFCTPC